MAGTQPSSLIRLEDFLRITTDAVICINREQHILIFNTSAERIFGYCAEEILGRPLDLLIPERFVGNHHKHIQAFGAAPEAVRLMAERKEISGRRKDGSEFLARASIARIDRGEEIIFTVLLRDITERMQTEQALRESQARYESIIAAMEEGIVLQNADGNIQTCNASAERILGLSTDQMMGRTSIDPRWKAIHEDGSPFPGDTHPAMVTLDTGQPCSNVIMGVHKPDDTLTWISINTQPLFRPEAPQPYAVVSSFTDITERRRADNASREQEALLRKMLEVLPVGMWIVDQDGRVISGNPAGQKIWAGARYVGIDEYGEYRGWWADSGELIKPEEWAAARAIAKGEAFLDEVVNIQSFDGTFKTILNSAVPLRDLNQKIIGAIVVNQDITERMQSYQVLEQRVAERTRGMSALLEVSRNVASTLDLKPLLNLILKQLKVVVDYTNAGIVKLEGDEFVTVEHLGSIPREKMVQFRTSALSDNGYRRVVQTRMPVIIGELWADDPWIHKQQDQAGPEIRSLYHDIHSWMGVPLVAKDHLYGILRLDHTQPNYFTEEHARLVMAFAYQAAAAIENAGLYEQAQELAALEERQKLARELHDSVSQALYGIALGARTARTLIDRDPVKALEPLDYCLSLAEAGLAEMRALIFELRPESLELEGLIAALSKQADALRARYSIQVEVTLCEEPELPLTTKEALYRISQEALNNVVKHARASRVDLRLYEMEGMLILEVHDDGRGFEVTHAYPGHLGLSSMCERAERVGGSFQIESIAGKGTCVTARVPGTSL